mgnify:CR=1 FL=1
MRSACSALALPALFLLAGRAAAQPPPATDSAIRELEVAGTAEGAESRGAAPRIVGWTRVTDRPHYDNQPFFLDERTLLYTALGGLTDPKGDAEPVATELVAYDLESGERTLLVGTPESEYSPLARPASPDAPEVREISFVRDYGDLRQELWSASLQADGSAAPQRSLFPQINPIGYHVWVDHHSALLFVLGEPATLQLAAVGGAGRILAEAPGRALASIPGSDRFSFVDKGAATPGDTAAGGQPEDPAPSGWWLRSVVPSAADPSATVRQVIEMPVGVEDYAWRPGGELWAASGGELLRADLGRGEWRPVLDLRDRGVGGITRLAFSPSGRQLAIVFER